MIRQFVVRERAHDDAFVQPGLVHGTGRPAGNAQQEIAHRITILPSLIVKSMLEEVLEGRIVLRQRHEAVADIPGRRHAELFAQAPGAATLVCHGDDAG